MSALADQLSVARLKTIGLWALKLVLAALFLLAGGAKLAGVPTMVAVFDQVGLGHVAELTLQVVFHPRALHTAYGSAPDRPRRTFTLRFTGDDVWRIRTLHRRWGRRSRTSPSASWRRRAR